MPKKKTETTKKKKKPAREVDKNTKRRVKKVIDRYAKTQPHSRAVALTNKFRHNQRVKHKCKFKDREGIKRCPLKRHVQASARRREPIKSGSKKAKKANVPEEAPARKTAPHEGYTYGFWKQGSRSKYYKKILNSAKYVKSICKGGIGYGYARELARSGGFGFLVYAKKLNDRVPRHMVWDTNAHGEKMGIPVGFAVLRNKPDSIYIELVCSNKGGLGKNMMREIDTLAYHSYDKREVTLSAVPAAIGFYKKIGFKQSISDAQYRRIKEKDPDDDLLPMKKPLRAGKKRKTK